MSRSVGEQILRILKAIDRPGSFCVSGSRAAPLPGLEVNGVGPVGLPLASAQVDEVKAHCRQAPHGKGVQTLVDTRVRRVWQMDPDGFSLTNPDWQTYLDETVRIVQRELGLENEKLESHLYNLLLYEPGSFFLPHRDGEKLDRMVATLVIVLPGAFRGGELVVRHEGQERVVDFGAAGGNPFHTHHAAFYADCEHEVRPLQEGHRLCLVYNLTLAGSKTAVTAPRTAGVADELATTLGSWSDTDPPKLAVLLEHRYTQAGLTWDALKGVDRVKARVLAEAATQAGCRAYLALLTLEESGSAEEEYEPRSRRRRRGEDDEDEENEDSSGRYHMEEVFETTLSAEHWSDSEGNPLSFGMMAVEQQEVVPPDTLTKGKPEEDYEGYTGNEGMTLTRWYRHAAVFLWPDTNHYDAVCDCGLDGAIVSLAALVNPQQAARGKQAIALKAQCVAFADAILGRFGGTPRWLSQASGQLLLASLARLGDPRLLAAYLASVVAHCREVEPDADLVTACDAHGWRTFEKELTAVFEATAVATLGRNVRLLDRLSSSRSKLKADRRAVCRTLAEKVVDSLAKIDREIATEPWRARELDRSQVLTALARVTLAVERDDLLARVVTDTLANPKVYPLRAHIGALTSLKHWLATHLKKPSAAVTNWVAACCEQLEALTASEPALPADQRRGANLPCKCRLCEELRKFLTDPAESMHRFRAVQDRRSHLENEIGVHKCDLTYTTDRKGSPHTLVCTKTTASFDAKLKTYREDLEYLSALQTIRSGLPE